MKAPVALPLRMVDKGDDSYIKDAKGVVVIESTYGFGSTEAHKAWCRWVVKAANKSEKQEEAR